MNTEQRIKQIADEAIEKIKAIAAEKDEWPKRGDEYLHLTGGGLVFPATWDNDEDDNTRKARRRIAPNTDEGRARLEKLAEWESFLCRFYDSG